MSKKLVATRETLAELLHTALRKLGDSTPTSLAWNLINSYVTSSDEKGYQVWKNYLEFVWEGLPYVSDKTSYEEILKTFQQWVGIYMNSRLCEECAFYWW